MRLWVATLALPNKALRKKKLGFIPTEAWRFLLEKAGFWYSWSWKLRKSQGNESQKSAVQHVFQWAPFDVFGMC
jgi:hypothetical protein